VSVSSVTDPTMAASTAAAGSSLSQASAGLPASSGGLGQDAFLKLLVTQLEYQDPTAPQDNATFIAQLATFASLEKLSAIESSLKTLTELVAGSLAVDLTNTPTAGA